LAFFLYAPPAHIFLAVLGAGLVLLGPGAWSLDARLFGRKRLIPERQARLETLWFPVEPCYVFHTLNAYDDGDRVCVDVCRYAGRYDVSLMTGPGPVTLDRWTIDPVGGKVTLRSLSDRFFQEFPRVEDRVISRSHRYGYTTSFKQLQDKVVAPATVKGHRPLGAATRPAMS
jgi:carotenoid cleavage dioxygenase